MAKKKGHGSRWMAGALLVLLIVGLAGFGARNFGGRIQSLGKVGDSEIDVQRYANALRQELRAISQQSGQNITLSQARQFGLDQAVLQRVVAAVALENEAQNIGLSVGDAEVKRQITADPNFQGASGGFDKTAYEFVLQRNNLKPAQYEDTLRRDTASSILQAAITTPVEVPAIYGKTILDYVGQRRSFTWAKLDETTLAEPVRAPSEEELQAWFDEHPDDFVLPAEKKITYAWLSPDMMLDQVSVDDAQLKELYDQRSDKYNTPERRLVERLVFPDQQSAKQAMEAITSGSKSFEDVVKERGLTLDDIDLGDATRESLGKAADAVFALKEPGLVGPVETDLGPALIRVNAILVAQHTSFEDVRESLRKELAADSARRLVADRMSELDDLLAGGATLEELADETDMKLGKIDWIEGGENDDPIAGYEAFNKAAAQVQEGDFPEMLELSDGGLFALRLDEAVPERPDTFEHAREKVAAEWHADELGKRLRAEAEKDLAMLDGKELSSLGLPVTVQTNMLRSGFVEGVPPAFMEKVFGLSVGDAGSVEGDDAVFLVQLKDIQPPDETDPDVAAVKTGVARQMQQSLGQDMLTAFTRATELEAGISLNQAAVNAVNAQFP